jgi:hypothetical protein
MKNMTTPTYCSTPQLDLRPRTAVRVIRKAGALAAVALGICAAAVSAQASVLAGWSMSGLPGGSGNYGPSPFAPDNTDPNLTVGGLTRGSGVGTSGTGAAKAWGGNAWNVTSESAAISGNLFATFTLTPKAGYKVSLSDIAAYNIRRSGTGPTTGIWQYQVGTGGFTDIGSSITWGSNTSSTGNGQGSVNLSGISALQNVPAGTTITIRLVNWNASGSSGTWYFNGQGTTPNLTFNGTVDPLDVPPDAPVANDPGSVTSSAFAANWSSSVGATGYRLDVSASSAFDSFVAGYNDLDAGNVTSSAVTGLSANTTYYYRVRAYNASGTSGNSNIKSATTSGSVAATKMTVTLPGQPAANTGTPTPQNAGTPFNVTLTAVFDDGTTVDTTYSGSRGITFSGPSGSPVYPASVTFNSGVGIASIVLNKAEDTTLTATDSLLTGIASSTFSVTPAIYHWIASGSASWTDAASWSPARVSPGADDTLLFDQGGASTATDVPSQTIVSLQVSNNTSITLQAAASATLNIAGGANAFTVGSGSALTANSGAVTLNIPSGSSATIGGAITFASGGHRLLAVDGGSVTFQTGSSFTADTGFSGNAFGTANLNSIVFASGSTYIQKAGSNPFGASQPSSVVTFQTGSLYRVAVNAAPSFSGRTYADLEINAPAFNQSSTGGGVLTMDNLNVVSGTLNLNLTGGIHIKGNVTVSAGQTLAFSPASIGGVSFNGSAPQTISGGGTINFGASSSVSVPSGSTLLIDTGVGTASGATLTVDGTLGGNSSITGAGIVTINPGGVLAPGASIGTLTFDTAPALQGATSLELNRNASPNADQIALTAGTLNFGGSLVLTNGGAALADGDSFTLFTASGFNGWFNDVAAPSLASGLTLDTNKLSQTGILDVYAFTPAGGSVPLSVVKNVAADLPLTTVFAHTAGGRGALALASATGASHGVIATNATTLTYTPDANYVGSDSFICSVADTNNGIANVTVAVTVTGSGGGNTSTLAIQQSGTNFSVTVTGNAGSNYQLQRSAALSPTNWQAVGDVFTMPVSGSTNISVTPAGNTGFYRTVIP